MPSMRWRHPVWMSVTNAAKSDIARMIAPLRQKSWLSASPAMRMAIPLPTAQIKSSLPWSVPRAPTVRFLETRPVVAAVPRTILQMRSQAARSAALANILLPTAQTSSVRLATSSDIEQRTTLKCFATFDDRLEWPVENYVQKFCEPNWSSIIAPLSSQQTSSLEFIKAYSHGYIPIQGTVASAKSYLLSPLLGGKQGCR